MEKGNTTFLRISAVNGETDDRNKLIKIIPKALLAELVRKEMIF